MVVRTTKVLLWTGSNENATIKIATRMVMSIMPVRTTHCTSVRMTPCLLPRKLMKVHAVRVTMKAVEPHQIRMYAILMRISGDHVPDYAI